MRILVLKINHSEHYSLGPGGIESQVYYCLFLWRTFSGKTSSGWKLSDRPASIRERVGAQVGMALAHGRIPGWCRSCWAGGRAFPMRRHHLSSPFHLYPKVLWAVGEGRAGDPGLEAEGAEASLKAGVKSQPPGLFSFLWLLLHRCILIRAARPLLPQLFLKKEY